MTTHLAPSNTRRMDRNRGGSRTLSPSRVDVASSYAASPASHLVLELHLPRFLHVFPAWRTALVVVLLAVAAFVMVALVTATGLPTPSPSTVLPNPQPAGF